MHATVAVPGSKSQTNRALVLAALGDGTSTVTGALRSRDTDLMIGALGTLGLDVEDSDTDVTVSGQIDPGPHATVAVSYTHLTLPTTPYV